MNLNKSADKKRLLFARRIYFVWIFFSVLISLFWSKNIAALYFDLPEYFNKAPRFLVSEAYLIFFVPALIAAIAGGTAGIIFVLKQYKSIFHGHSLLKTRSVIGVTKKF